MLGSRESDILDQRNSITARAYLMDAKMGQSDIPIEGREMSARAISSRTQPATFSARSGTLKHVAGIENISLETLLNKHAVSCVYSSNS